MTDVSPHADLFSSLHTHLKAIEHTLHDLENKMNILYSESRMKQELESQKKEIRLLNHMIDERECEILALKTKLNAAYI